MNEPDLNHFHTPSLPLRLSGQAALAAAVLTVSLLLAGSVFGFTDQSADHQVAAKDRGEAERAARRAALEAMARQKARETATAARPVLLADARRADADRARRAHEARRAASQ